MALRASNNSQKIIASTTSQLFGGYECEEILLALAWPGRRHLSSESRQRTAFVVALKTEEIEQLPGTKIPEHSYLGEAICAYLSLLFGKRCDSHGYLEIGGTFYVPDMLSYTTTFKPGLPQNSATPRFDFGVFVNLAEFSRIRRLVFGEPLDEQFLRTFHAACKFYHQALQMAEQDTEVAYLNLITAGEILSGFYEYDKKTLLSKEDKAKVDRIWAMQPDGPELGAFILSRIFQVKRCFVSTISRFIDDAFFDRSESADPFGAFKKETFEKSICAAYDLRSRYVHTGLSFGRIVFLAAGGMNPEVQLGKPIVGDKELEKVLHRAPTYVGLERVIRYCLIKFAEENGAYEPLEPHIALALSPQPAVEPPKTV